MTTPFKDRLKAWRIGKGYTQKAAAAEIGVATKTYQGWEYGYYMPSKRKCIDCIEQKIK